MNFTWKASYTICSLLVAWTPFVMSPKIYKDGDERMTPSSQMNPGIVLFYLVSWVRQKFVLIIP